MVARRGEIWWANLPEPSGSEPGYRRPVVVVQADAFNVSALQTVICVALSSNLSLAQAPGNVRLTRHQTGLPKESVANVSQIFTIDDAALDEHVGSLGLSSMRRIDEGLRLVLNL